MKVITPTKKIVAPVPAVVESISLKNTLIPWQKLTIKRNVEVVGVV